MTAPWDESKLPDVEDVFLKTPLYSAIPLPIDLADINKTPQAIRSFMWEMRVEAIQFDAHCTMCGQTSTFKSPKAGNVTWVPPLHLLAGFFERDFTCQRLAAHKYKYLFLMGVDRLQKVGQYPSMEDIASSDMERFRKILGKNDFAELHRAGGLISSGIGIGSFVYLRRIFERLINKTRNRASNEGSVFSDFDGKKMDEKIGLLKNYLPPNLVKHKVIYGIISRGIHELDEETCKRYFPVIKAAIVDILEQDLEAENKRIAEAELEKAINAISSELGGKKTQ